MTIAVVFDSAGTLLYTYRHATDVINHKSLPGIETTMLTCSNPDRVLCVIHSNSRDIMDAPADELASQYMQRNNIAFGVACAGRVVTTESIRDVIYADTHAKMHDFQESLIQVWQQAKKEEIVALNNGLIVNVALSRIEFVVSAAGYPFEGARETITGLHQLGVPAFIASGDREAKLEKIADYLGIPHERVFGVATPSVKAQIVTDLKEYYDQVMMVGDSVNDLKAMKVADIAVLTMQQCATKHRSLIDEADYTITDVREVLGIISEMDTFTNSPDDDCRNRAVCHNIRTDTPQ